MAEASGGLFPFGEFLVRLRCEYPCNVVRASALEEPLSLAVIVIVIGGAVYYHV
jgi:hypothetical protein